MRVKCQPDGELSVGRKVKESLAVHIPHPAATHNGKGVGNDSNASCNCCRVRILHPSGDGFH